MISVENMCGDHLLLGSWNYLALISSPSQMFWFKNNVDNYGWFLTKRELIMINMVHNVVKQNTRDYNKVSKV